MSEKTFGVLGMTQRIKENKLMICAHRGTTGGNILQNTVASAKNCVLHGADIFEVDATLSKDGVFFGFHDGVEKEVLLQDLDLRTLTAAEIENLQVYNSISEVTSAKIQRLETIFEQLKDVCYINIDRSWFYGDAIIKFVEQSKIKDQIILKSPAEPEFLKLLSQSKENIMYMPILKTLEDWKKVQEFDLNLIAAELIFTGLDHPLVSKEFLAELKAKNILPWINMITLGDKPEHNLSGFLDDNHLILEGPKDNLHVAQEMGFRIIQTDWPYLIRKHTKV